METHEHSRRGRKRKLPTNTQLNSRPTKRRKNARDHQQRYCVCQQPDDGRPMVGCDSCQDWFHPLCVGTTLEQARVFTNWLCPKCASNRQSSNRNVARTKVRIPIQPARAPRLELDEMEWTNGYRFCGTRASEAHLPQAGASSALFRDKLKHFSSDIEFFDPKRVDTSGWDLEGFDFMGYQRRDLNNTIDPHRPEVKEREPPPNFARVPTPSVPTGDGGMGSSGGVSSQNVNAEVESGIDDEMEVEERIHCGTVWFNVLSSIRQDYVRREMNIFENLLSSRNEVGEKLSHLFDRSMKLTRALRNLRYLNLLHGKVTPSQNGTGAIAEYKVTPPANGDYSVAFLNVNHIDYNETIPCPKCGGQIPSPRILSHVHDCFKDDRPNRIDTNTCRTPVSFVSAIDLDSDVVSLHAVCGYAMYLSSDRDASRSSLSAPMESVATERRDGKVPDANLKTDADGDGDIPMGDSEHKEREEKHPCTLADEFIQANPHPEWEDRTVFCLDHSYPCSVHGPWRDERFVLQRGIKEAREEYGRLSAAIDALQCRFQTRRKVMHEWRRDFDSNLRKERRSLASPIGDVFDPEVYRIGKSFQPFLFPRKRHATPPPTAPPIVPKTDHQHVKEKPTTEVSKPKTPSISSSPKPEPKRRTQIVNGSPNSRRTPNGITSHPNPSRTLSTTVPAPSDGNQPKISVKTKHVPVQVRSRIADGSERQRPTPLRTPSSVPRPMQHSQTTHPRKLVPSSPSSASSAASSTSPLIPRGGGQQVPLHSHTQSLPHPRPHGLKNVAPSSGRQRPRVPGHSMKQGLKSKIPPVPVPTNNSVHVLPTHQKPVPSHLGRKRPAPLQQQHPVSMNGGNARRSRHMSNKPVPSPRGRMPPEGTRTSFRPLASSSPRGGNRPATGAKRFIPAARGTPPQKAKKVPPQTQTQRSVVLATNGANGLSSKMVHPTVNRGSRSGSRSSTPSSIFVEPRKNRVPMHPTALSRPGNKMGRVPGPTPNGHRPGQTSQPLSGTSTVQIPRSPQNSRPQVSRPTA